MIKLFRTTGMYSIPRRGEYFRVGKYVGRCILSLLGIAVMKVSR